MNFLLLLVEDNEFGSSPNLSSIIHSLQGVDILVFPECGLTTVNVPTVREDIFPYVTEIPAVGVSPCDSKQMPDVLTKLSCAARDKRMYIVVNLDELVHCDPDVSDCPSDGSLFYNTNIAFDRHGSIVAKYRKFNLFDEPEFNITKNPDHTWFDTDFGVRFGMFICFDILFYEPTGYLLKQNISNFVYSTAWFSELPYLTAVSVQAGWAYNNDVNILAAGYSNATRGLGGSGIYAGRDGRLIATFSEHSSSKLLIAKVNSDHRGVQPFVTEEFTFKEVKNSELSFFHADIEKFTTVEVTGEHSKLVYENEGFTCDVSVKISSDVEGPKYRLVAFSGTRTYGLVRTVYMEICGVVACANHSLSSCSQRISSHSLDVTLTNISISASSNKHLLTYPITLDRYLLSLENKSFLFNTKEQNGNFKMSMDSKHPINNVCMFSIFRNT